MITFECGSCHKLLRVSDEKAGHAGKCPACGSPVTVPPLEIPLAAESAPAPAFQPPQASAPVGSLLTERAGPRCPSCGKPLAANAKICPPCGIRVPSGRPLLTVRDVDEDAVQLNAEKIVRGVSWVVPLGIYPIYSEAMGRRRPYVTWAIAAITIILSIYAWTDDEFLVKWMLWGGSPHAQKQHIPGLTALELATLYRPYQLLTHAFLHADLLHLAGNLVFLLVLGSRVNAVIGNIGMLLLYPALAAGAAQAHLWSAADEGIFPMLGASGAIMGLAGMYLILFPLQKVYMMIWLRWGLFRGFKLSQGVFRAAGIYVVFAYIAFDVFYVAMRIQSGTAHWAHIGGMIAGISLAFLLLVSRLLYCPGDLLSLSLGRLAWPLLGKPASRQKINIG